MSTIYGGVSMPEAVRAEIANKATSEPSLERILDAPFVETVAVANRTAVDLLSADLHVGEAEAIVLALESQARLLVMDERQGRAIAQLRGISVTGTVGVLLEARGRGLVGTLRVELQQLRNNRFWLSDDLVERILRLAGEK